MDLAGAVRTGGELTVEASDRSNSRRNALESVSDGRRAYEHPNANGGVVADGAGGASDRTIARDGDAVREAATQGRGEATTRNELEDDSDAHVDGVADECADGAEANGQGLDMDEESGSGA